MKKLKDLSAEKFFLLAGTFFGLLFLIMTPPLQGPDEINHFYRAYQLSEGQILPIRNGQRLGGNIPDGLIAFTQTFKDLRWETHKKTNYQRILASSGISLNADKKTFADFPNTSLYSPVSYLPSTVGIFLGRVLNLPPFYLFYLGRIFTLAFWILLAYLAIKTVPQFKWMWCVLAMLPMSVFINMTLSADVVTNAVAFYCLALLLHHIFNPGLISTKMYLLLLLLAAALTLAKLVYLPLMLLYLLVPLKKFKSVYHYLVGGAGILLLSLMVFFLWSQPISGLYIPAAEYEQEFSDISALGWNANANEQADLLMRDPGIALKVIRETLLVNLDYTARGYVGELGWLDTHFPDGFILLVSLLLLYNLFAEPRTTDNKKILITILGLVILVVSFSLLVLSQLLTWAPIGFQAAMMLQGRYLIPLAPLVPFLFLYPKLKLLPFKSWILMVSVLLMGVYTTYTIYTRYYRIPIFSNHLVYCSAEKLNSDSTLASESSGDTLGSGKMRTNEFARTGAYSLKSGGSDQFIFTYKTKMIGFNDMVEVFVWRKGNTGSLIVDGHREDVYEGDDHGDWVDHRGWSYMQYSFKPVADLDGKEIGIYIYNASAEVSYYDDFVIWHRKLLGYK